MGQENDPVTLTSPLPTDSRRGWLVLCLTCIGMVCIIAGFTTLYLKQATSERRMQEQIERMSRQVNAIRYSQMFTVSDLAKIWGTVQELHDKLPSQEQVPRLPRPETPQGHQANPGDP